MKQPQIHIMATVGYKVENGVEYGGDIRRAII